MLYCAMNVMCVDSYMFFSSSDFQIFKQVLVSERNLPLIELQHAISFKLSFNEHKILFPPHFLKNFFMLLLTEIP